MTQADKLAAVYAAKLNIREAIKAKGVAITNSEPFSGYAAKILLIEGDGGGGSIPEDVTNGFGVTDMATLIFIPMAEYGTSEIFAIYGKTSELAVDDAIVLYPPTNENSKTEIADVSNLIGITPVETVEFVFSLWAFAESFKPHMASRYDYNADWVEFSDKGAYVKDGMLVNTGKIGVATENGVYFSAPLPNKQSYANIIQLTARVSEVANG